ncbi:MAG: DUF5610 domain-containing protein [Nitrosomonas sp.]|nr:DUF5610 domain-containing protein [Nitrosomonas sp.]
MDIQSFSQSVRSLAQADNKKEIGPIGHQISEMAHTRNAERKQLDAPTSESTVNLNAANDPQALVLQTALEGINEALHETLGENTIQATQESNIDITPNVTAERIASLSTEIFPAFQEQHPELPQNEALNTFVSIINEGLNAGITEARDILTNMNALQTGDNAKIIDDIYALTQEKLQSFIDNFNNSDTTPA